MTATSDEAFEIQLRQEFLQEAAELLQSTESAFLKLEREPQNLQIVDQVFRAVHTIKGSAAVAGFDELARFAHVLETLLGAIRDRKVIGTKAVVDALLGGADALGRFVAELRRDSAARVDVSGERAAIEAASHLSGVAASSAAPTPRLSVPKVMIVEDMVELRELIADLIAPLGVEVLTAGDGTAAMELWDANLDTALVITDQTMPSANGTDLIAHIRRTNTTVPVIVVSGITDRADAVNFVNLGVLEFFAKPFDGRALMASVDRALRKGRYQAALEELSRLTIRSFLTFRQVLVRLQNVDTLDPLVTRLSEQLHEMGTVVARVLVRTTDEDRS